MNRALNFYFTLLFSLTFPASVYAQCFSDAGKHICFQYTGLWARITEKINPVDGTTLGFILRDFATATANPNLFSLAGNRVDGHLWTRVTPIADDPNFVYEPKCDNNENGIPDGEEGLPCIGTYKFPARFYNPYSQLERWVGSAENLIGVAFPSCDQNKAFSWRGTVRIESIEKPLPWDPNTIVNVQPFYSFDPTKFTTPDGTAGGICEAYENAWQAWDAFVDVTWDSDIQRLVAPYANFWHNQLFWERGWQTKVSITNQTGQTVDYTIENHLWSGDHGTAQDACALHNEGQVETTVSILNGRTQEIDAFRFHVLDTVRSSHDTVLFIRPNPILGGTVPSVHVFSNASGTPLCQ